MEPTHLEKNNIYACNTRGKWGLQERDSFSIFSPFSKRQTRKLIRKMYFLSLQTSLWCKQEQLLALLIPQMDLIWGIMKPSMNEHGLACQYFFHIFIWLQTHYGIHLHPTSYYSREELWAHLEKTGCISFGPKKEKWKTLKATFSLCVSYKEAKHRPLKRICAFFIFDALSIRINAFKLFWVASTFFLLLWSPASNLQRNICRRAEFLLPARAFNIFVFCIFWMFMIWHLTIRRGRGIYSSVWTAGLQGLQPPPPQKKKLQELTCSEDAEKVPTHTTSVSPDELTPRAERLPETS